MSMMRCSQCDRDVDTDFNDFDFDGELCERCIEKQEAINDKVADAAFGVTE